MKLRDLVYDENYDCFWRGGLRPGFRNITWCAICENIHSKLIETATNNLVIRTLKWDLRDHFRSETQKL